MDAWTMAGSFEEFLNDKAAELIATITNKIVMVAIRFEEDGMTAQLLQSLISLSQHFIRAERLLRSCRTKPSATYDS